MSTDRISSGKTHAYPGPYIKKTCRWCGKKVKPPRRCWCGDKCIDLWRIRTDASFARYMVEQRDKGVCNRCGIDTRKLEKVIRQFKSDLGSIFGGQWQRTELRVGGRKVGYGELWQAHHTQAVVEGGGGCDLDGLETLCLWCHGDETKKLAARLAGKRKEGGATQQELPSGTRDQH